mmetsp:Transcript_106531/g.206315  ORF Transcript_106531/g.206315 Transcript_106531/m.206315 type:complete len:284 (-) Transcript_106531:53-904(-)
MMSFKKSVNVALVPGLKPPFLPIVVVACCAALVRRLLNKRRRSAALATLKGRVVLVTGATNGLSKQVAMKAAASGANVAVAGQGFNALEQLSEQISRQETGQCVPFEYDTADASGLAAARLVSAVVDRFGRLDAVVSAASATDDLGAAGAFGKWAPGALGRVMDSNFASHEALARIALPLLKAVRGSFMSLSATASNPGNQAAVLASKAAASSLFLALWGDMKKHGVGCTVVCPGGKSDSAEEAERSLSAMIYGEPLVYTEARQAFVAALQPIAPHLALKLSD